MASASTQFQFVDSASFETNITAFSEELTKLNHLVAPVLSVALPALASETQDRTSLWDALFATSASPCTVPTEECTAPQPAIPVQPAATHSGWFLECLEIEGFRGINNEGTPLVLKFKPDCVNSISAPNGVGKSSIFDALSFAIRDTIPKLDRLLQAERPQDYYLNRFHPGMVGTIKLTLKPDNGGSSVQVTIERDRAGKRTVSGPAGIDAGALLNEINREFVLLDGETFRSFVDDKALDRGRAFSGLLGLARYSTLRQQLQALANTRSFNAHFDTNAHAAKLATTQRTIKAAQSAIALDFAELAGEPLTADTSIEEAQNRCHAALKGIPVLSQHCDECAFQDIDIEVCINAIRSAEDGPAREQLGTVIREHAKWSGANQELPSDDDYIRLFDFALAREKALETTSGDLLRKLYQTCEQIMLGDTWSSPTICPACGKDDGTSVLDIVQHNLRQYEEVERATSAITAEWTAKGWHALTDLEKLALTESEISRVAELTKTGEAGTVTSAEVTDLIEHIKLLRARAKTKLQALASERTEIESKLPQSLVAVTTAVETARRLKKNWRTLAEAKDEEASEANRAAILKELKLFLDSAASIFAKAESEMAAARLAKVEPLCQELFNNIMNSPVVPILNKPQGSEELSIRLAKFWGLQDMSAQALLSESYRNGFAVSVYLAAASLYGGAPRFIILDDITSSFDAGNQHYLIEVIRTRFARPLTPTGPQVILLSHDTLLEKLFNKHSSSTQWAHQRLEGTAHTAVLPQSGAVNHVRNATLSLLNAGRVSEAAPRIRQYLEYTLNEVIDKCNIPVPPNIAFGDDRRTAGEYFNAITTAVKLYKAAGLLVLDKSQEQALQMHSAIIISNFLSHWSTAQAQAFSASALLGVMAAIDAFPDCFKYEPNPGEPKRYYRSLQRK